MAMKKKIIYTENAPEAIGPYSQAVEFGGVIYCSGQIALQPESMQIVDGGVKEQTRQVMKNLGEVLKAADTSFENVLKCSIFLHDMKDFPDVNEVYGEYFDEFPPARETVAVKELPKSVLVEISCIVASN
jgi:2-iminobutanoate/2-iminopropanoate deaminase